LDWCLCKSVEDADITSSLASTFLELLFSFGSSFGVFSFSSIFFYIIFFLFIFFSKFLLSVDLLIFSSSVFFDFSCFASSFSFFSSLFCYSGFLDDFLNSLGIVFFVFLLLF